MNTIYKYNNIIIRQGHGFLQGFLNVKSRWRFLRSTLIQITHLWASLEEAHFCVSNKMSKTLIFSCHI